MRGSVVLYVVVALGIVAIGAILLRNPNKENLSPEVSNVKETLEEKTSTYNKSVTDYSEGKFAEIVAQGKTPVLYFRADWCPTCRVADAAFKANPEGIPEDVVLLKINYDTASQLKKQYGITIQHTFVQVDTNGNEVTKWIGGDIKELKDNLIT